MEIKRTTEIFVETKRRIIVRGAAAAAASSSEPTVCHICGEQMLAAEEIAALCGISRRAAYKLVEADTVHFAEDTAGVVVICLASLQAETFPDRKVIRLPDAGAENI